MRLKSSFLKTDFRHHQLVSSFVPLLSWVGAVIIIASFTHHRWGIPSAILLFCLGGIYANRLPSIAYAIASKSLPAPLKGSPGTDYLLFNSEPPETFHKLKIIPDDAGYLFAENGCYRITTLHQEFTIPFTAFHHEPIKKGGAVRALLLRFEPSGTHGVVEIAATFGYSGSDLKVAADPSLKCAWASKVIDLMKVTQCAPAEPPPLPLP